MRRVQKIRPLKKVRETDAIFQNVLQENKASDARQDSLRISIDSRAKLDLGEFSRGGVLRAATATMTWKDLFPAVRLLEKTYEKGVRVAKKLFQTFSHRLQRDAALPRYFVRISPESPSG